MSDSVAGNGYSARALLHFEQLTSAIPPAAAINQARLNVSFTNWDPVTYLVQVCALAKPWVATKRATAVLNGLGWQRTGAVLEDGT